MGIPFIHGPGTVGREDRLVRGCIALSLILLAGFPLVLSGESNAFTIVFLVGGLYFAVTAALGRDLVYAHFDVDTRRDGPSEEAPQEEAAPQEYEPWPPLQHRWVDVRDSDSDTHAQSSGTSLLGS